MSVISGSTRGRGGQALARHLLSSKHDQVVTVIEPRGLVAASFEAQVDELGRGAVTTRTAQPIYHVHCDPVEWNEQVRNVFWIRFEEEFGLAEARYCGAIHSKHGRKHEHRLYDLTRDDAKVASLRFDRLRREKVAALVAWECNLAPPPIKHARAVATALKKEGRTEVAAFLRGECDHAVRIAPKTPQERAVEERKSTSKLAIAENVLAAWQVADNGRAFQNALAEQNLILAAGEKVPVIVDQTGAAWPLARLLGQSSRQQGVRVRVAAVRELLAGLELPSLGEARWAINEKTGKIKSNIVTSRPTEPVEAAIAEQPRPAAEKRRTGEVSPNGLSANATKRLAERLQANTTHGPIETILRYFERREHYALKQLADLAQPIREPFELVGLRQRADQSAVGTREIRAELDGKVRLLAALSRARPRGFWAWIVGKSHAHKRAMEAAEQQRADLSDKLDRARRAESRVDDDLNVHERSWLHQRWAAELYRARHRAAVLAELSAIAAARARIVKSGALAILPSARESAIEELGSDRRPIVAKPVQSADTVAYRPRF